MHSVCHFKRLQTQFLNLVKYTRTAAMSKLLDQVREEIRVRHYSIRTEEAYLNWIRRFILFHGKRRPMEMGESEVQEFLTHLAVEGKVAASTQNQALQRASVSLQPGAGPASGAGRRDGAGEEAGEVAGGAHARGGSRRVPGARLRPPVLTPPPQPQRSEMRLCHAPTHPIGFPPRSHPPT